MDERSRRIERRFEIPMLIAALLVIPLLLVQWDSLPAQWRWLEPVLDWGTWLVFLAELVTMLAVVPDKRAWLRRHPVEVVTTICTPPVLPSTLAAARLLRLLWVLRLLRVAPLLRRRFTLTAVRYAAVLALVTVLAGGAAFAAVEHHESDWTGIWWAVETMTTVGYGDVYPRTVAGRVIGIVVMTVGIGFGTLLVGAIAERFLASHGEIEAEELEQRIELSDAELRDELHELTARLGRIEAALRERAG